MTIDETKCDHLMIPHDEIFCKCCYCGSEALNIKTMQEATLSKLTDEENEALKKDANWARLYRRIRNEQVGLPCACEVDDDGKIMRWCTVHAQMRDENEALRKDAERYRLLRKFVDKRNLPAVFEREDEAPIVLLYWKELDEVMEEMMKNGVDGE